MSDEDPNRYNTQKVWFNVIGMAVFLFVCLGIYGRWALSMRMLNQTQTSTTNHVPQEPPARITGNSPKTKPTPRVVRNSTEVHREPSSSTQAEAPPPKPLHPVKPISGLPSDTSLTIQECEHDGGEISCWGYIALSTDIPTQECFGVSTLTDDLGNQYRFRSKFSDGGQIATMIPSQNYRFTVRVDDPHPAVQTVSVLLEFQEQCNQFARKPENRVVFTNVPVNQ